MSKRGASNYLTHDNWDREDDDDNEEAGVFKSASEDTLQKRTIIRAKRKIQGEAGEATKKNTFSGFSFGSNSSESGFKLPTFNFSKTEVVKESDKSEAKSNGKSVIESVTASKDTQSAVAQKESKSEGIFKIPEECSTISATASDENPDDAYMRQMKQLNQSFSKWVSNCISKNPECILTPCFDDYIKYIDKIDKLYPVVSSTSSATSAFLSKNSTSTSEDETKKISQSDETKRSLAPAFSFGSTEQTVNRIPTFGTLSERSSSFAASVNKEASPKKDSQPFVFGVKQNESSSTAAVSTSTFTFPKFSFTTGSAGTSSSGTGSAFPSFGQGFFSKSGENKSSEVAADQTGAAGGDDEDYEPPKAEVVENSEEDAFHSVRCKLYYKKGDKFEERGVGFLYLKPNGTKTQLLIRTDTALGNILLNINVEKLMPVSKQGKNNITIICVPNPPVDPKDVKPVPMLIRVKTEEDADDLLKKIVKCQDEM